MGVALLGVGYFKIQSQSGVGTVAAQVTTTNPPVMDVTALKTKAETGDPAAQTLLARAYLDGTGVKASVKEAVKWLCLATNQNYPEALATLGELTQAGQGVPANPAEAARMYLRAADQGCVSAQYDLAYLYEQGSGVKQDEQAAAKWYELAAEGGDALAQYDIGQRYTLGVGVAMNRVQAWKWLSLAASQGQPDSTKLLAGLKREMSADELSQASQLISQFTASMAR